MAPEVRFSDGPLRILLGKLGLLSFPLSFQLGLVGPEPRVRHLLAATGEASPPADALPAGEAAPADGLAPLGASLGLRVPPGHAAGELLQGTTQRHDRIHHRGLFCANVRGRSRALLHHRMRQFLKLALVCKFGPAQTLGWKKCHCLNAECIEPGCRTASSPATRVPAHTCDSAAVCSYEDLTHDLAGD